MKHRKKKICVVTFIVIISTFCIYFKDFFVEKLDTTSINSKSKIDTYTGRK